MLWLPLQGVIAAVMPLCAQAKESGASLDMPVVTAACDLHHDDDKKFSADGTHDEVAFNPPCEGVACFTSFSILLPSAHSAPIFIGGSAYAAAFDSRFTSTILQQPQRPPLA